MSLEKVGDVIGFVVSFADVHAIRYEASHVTVEAGHLMLYEDGLPVALYAPGAWQACERCVISRIRDAAEGAA